MAAPDLAAMPRLRKPQDGLNVKTGIVHLGLGAFFRAHGAIYIAEAILNARLQGPDNPWGENWGIIGVSLMRPDQRDALAPQDFAYSAVELAPEGEKRQVISVLNTVLVARENPQAVLEAMADEMVKIVSLTITEKGYCHEPATGRLNQDHHDIQHDLANPDTPVTAIGMLVQALKLRRARGLLPFTVLCCDNLPENGKVVRRVVCEFAHLIDPALADWIAREGAFPATMVDRIVPATKPEDIAALAQKTGQLDLSPVFHEPFRQWVVEDDFVQGARPDFKSVGVELVKNVTPYEHMKLRCLNGTHSSLAYLGYLAGKQTIADCMAEPLLAEFCKNLWRHEITPGLAPQIATASGIDLEAYTAALFARYQNPAIAHRTWQIAMDGSQKLPQRILSTIGENLEQNLPIDGLCLAVAAWMRYVGGVDEKGNSIDVRDPLAEVLLNLSQSHDTAQEKVQPFLTLGQIFPQALSQNEKFRQKLVSAYQSLETKGALLSIKDYLS